MVRNCPLEKNPAPDASRISARKPRQARGEARVTAILDAAARLICEKGIVGMTMHALAERAQTSIGSLYHFFRDREDVIDALYERHSMETQAINDALCAIPATTWVSLASADAMDRILMPYLHYLSTHNDYLPVMQHCAFQRKDKTFLHPLKQMLHARLPKLSKDQLEDHATMLHLIAAGTMHAGLQFAPAKLDLYIQEIPRVLKAYMVELEKQASKASSPPSISPPRSCRANSV